MTCFAIDLASICSDAFSFFFSVEALSKEKFVEILGAQKEVSAESAQSMLAQRHGPSPAKPAGPIIDPRSLTSGAPVLQKPAVRI
jgi:hypothetical protein